MSRTPYHAYNDKGETVASFAIRADAEEYVSAGKAIKIISDDEWMEHLRAAGWIDDQDNWVYRRGPE